MMKPYVLITGASSGLGRKLAVELSPIYPLILSGRNEERLRETKELCQGKKDIRLWIYDFAFFQSVEDDFANLLKEQSVGVQALVYCAGISRILPLRSISASMIEESFSVNAYSPALLTKVLSQKRYNGTNMKSVVFVSSIISDFGAKGHVLYGASKSALDGIMRNLAMELAPQIRVNSILPGGLLTEMTEEFYSDQKRKEASERMYPLGIGKPESIIPMVKFLISDDSRWITGQQFVVDGGRTINLTEGEN